MSTTFSGKIHLTKKRINADLSETVLEEHDIWNVCTEHLDSLVYLNNKNSAKLDSALPTTGTASGCTVVISDEFLMPDRREVTSLVGTVRTGTEIARVLTPTDVKITIRFASANSTIRTIAITAYPGTSTGQLSYVVYAYKSLATPVVVTTDDVLDVEYQIFFPTDFSGSWVPTFAEANFPSLWYNHNKKADPTVCVSSCKTNPNSLKFLGTVIHEAPSVAVPDVPKVTESWPAPIGIVKHTLPTPELVGKVYRGLYYNVLGRPVFHENVHSPGDSYISNIFAKYNDDTAPFSEAGAPTTGLLEVKSDENDIDVGNNLTDFPRMFRVNINQAGIDIPATAAKYNFQKRYMLGFDGNSNKETYLPMQFTTPSSGFYEYIDPTKASYLPTINSSSFILKLSDRYVLTIAASRTGFIIHDIEQNDYHFVNAYTTNTADTFSDQVTRKKDVISVGVSTPFFEVGGGHGFSVNERVFIKRRQLRSTVTVTGSVFTITDGDAVSNGDMITIYGPVLSPLISGNTYYIRDVSGSDFALANTLGGSAISIPWSDLTEDIYILHSNAFPSASPTLAENTEYLIQAVTSTHISLKTTSGTTIVINSADTTPTNLEIHRIPNFIQATPLLPSADTTVRFLIADDTLTFGGLYQVEFDTTDPSLFTITRSAITTVCRGVCIDNGIAYIATNTELRKSSTTLDDSWDLDADWTTTGLTTLSTAIGTNLSGFSNIYSLKVKNNGSDTYFGFLSYTGVTTNDTVLRLGRLSDNTCVQTAQNVVTSRGVNNYDFTKSYLVSQAPQTSGSGYVYSRVSLSTFSGATNAVSGMALTQSNLLIVTDPYDDTKSYVLLNNGYLDINNVSPAVAMSLITYPSQSVWYSDTTARLTVHMRNGILYGVTSSAARLGMIPNPNASINHGVFENIVWRKYKWVNPNWVDAAGVAVGPSDSRSGTNGVYQVLNDGIYVKFDYTAPNLRSTFLAGMYHNIYVCDGIIKDDLTTATFEMAVYPKETIVVEDLSDETDSVVTTVPAVGNMKFQWRDVGSRVNVNNITGTGFGIACATGNVVSVNTTDITDVPFPAYVTDNVYSYNTIGTQISLISGNTFTVTGHHFQEGDEVYIGVTGTATTPLTLSDAGPFYKITYVNANQVQLKTYADVAVTVTTPGVGATFFIVGLKQSIKFKLLAPSATIRLSSVVNAVIGRDTTDPTKLKITVSGVPSVTDNTYTLTDYNSLANLEVRIHRITYKTATPVTVLTGEIYYQNSYVVELWNLTGPTRLIRVSSTAQAAQEGGSNITVKDWTPILSGGVGVYDQQVKLPMFRTPALYIGNGVSTGHYDPNFRCVEDFTNDGTPVYQTLGTGAILKLTKQPHYIKLNGTSVSFDRRNFLGSTSFPETTPAVKVGIASGTGMLIFPISLAGQSITNTSILIMKK